NRKYGGRTRSCRWNLAPNDERSAEPRGRRLGLTDRPRITDRWGREQDRPVPEASRQLLGREQQGVIGYCVDQRALDHVVTRGGGEELTPQRHETVGGRRDQEAEQRKDRVEVVDAWSPSEQPGSLAGQDRPAVQDILDVFARLELEPFLETTGDPKSKSLVGAGRAMAGPGRADGAPPVG